MNMDPNFKAKGVRYLGPDGNDQFPSATDTRLFLDDEPVVSCQGFSWSADEEGYVVGTLTYIMGDPFMDDYRSLRPGARFGELRVTWHPEDREPENLIVVRDIVIKTEHAGLAIDDIVMEVECTWSNDGN